MKEALKLALEALVCLKKDFDADQFEWEIADEAITAIKEALAQPEQEPVAWEQFYPEMGSPKLAYLPPTESPDNACYTPPQRTWVGLTDEEVGDLSDFAYTNDEEFVRNVEKYLKEKNNG